MEEKITKVEKKILDFLTGHYNQQLVDGHQSETKRLSNPKSVTLLLRGPWFYRYTHRIDLKGKKW